MIFVPSLIFFFFFNDTATTEIYTLSLHDALPIYHVLRGRRAAGLQRHAARGRLDRDAPGRRRWLRDRHRAAHGEGAELGQDHHHHSHLAADERQLQELDRKSTRLNSSHLVISYAVFCLKQTNTTTL